MDLNLLAIPPSRVHSFLPPPLPPNRVVTSEEVGRESDTFELKAILRRT